MASHPVAAPMSAWSLAASLLEQQRVSHLALSQDHLEASLPAGNAAVCSTKAQRQQQHEQRQQLPGELLQQHASATTWQPQQQWQQQQQLEQQLEQLQQQQQQQERQLLHMPPLGMAQQQQQHKRRRLGDLQQALQAPDLLVNVPQPLPASMSEQPSCSGASDNAVVGEEQCQPVQHQEHQLQLYRQQRQRHYEQQQHQRKYEQQQQWHGEQQLHLLQQGRVPQWAANDEQRHCLQTGSLTELNVNQASLPQDAAGARNPRCGSQDGVQGVHTVRGAAGPADADTLPGTSAAVAAAKAGNPEQLKQEGNSRCREHDKDMRQVSSSHLDCAVCKDLLAAAHALSCGHMFCGVCLAQWLELRQEPSCPSCRAPVKSVPVRLFAMDDIAAEAQLSQGSECQERAARLQQWGEIKDATLAHWQQRFQPDTGSSKHGSKKAVRHAAGGGTAQQQANPRMLAGIVPLLAAARQGRPAAGIQAGASAMNQPAAHQVQRQQTRPARQAHHQQAGAAGPAGGAASAAAMRSGLGAAAIARHTAAGRRRGRGGKGRHAGVAVAQQPAAARQVTQLQQQRVEVPHNLRQMAINTFVSGTMADSAGRQ